MIRAMAKVTDREGTQLEAILELADFRGKRVLEIGCGDGRLTFGYAGDAASVHAAFNLADGHVAVDVVGCERHFARQLQNYALAAFRDRAERREDAAPVSLDADAKLARVVYDFDLAELQVFTLLC